MPDTINTLYLSYDGLTDPLGSSQVLPYLVGLSAKGYTIHVVSFEKSDRFQKDADEIRKICTNHQIVWHPMRYSKRPPIISTIYDLIRLRVKVSLLHRIHLFKLIHCRSYITAFVGLSMKKKHRLPFIFDMRGFFADERVDGGLWDITKFPYKQVYRFFKKAEVKFIKESDAIISLTYKGKQVMRDFPFMEVSDFEKIKVIPCCTDTKHFDPHRFTAKQIAELANKAGMQLGFDWFCYVGSLGTWYLVDEMLNFSRIFMERHPTWRLAVFTKDNPMEFRKMARKHGLSDQQYIVYAAARQELPALLAGCKASLFFIRACFSKQASSPTKQGEVMAMGLPVICNAGVGDTDDILKRYNAGICLNNFKSEYLKTEIEAMPDRIAEFNPSELRKGAFDYFSLDKGVENYDVIYRKLTFVKMS